MQEFGEAVAENVEIPMDEEVEGVTGETLSREGDTFDVSKGSPRGRRRWIKKSMLKMPQEELKIFLDMPCMETLHWNRSVAFINGMFTITIAVCNVVI